MVTVEEHRDRRIGRAGGVEADATQFGLPEPHRLCYGRGSMRLPRFYSRLVIGGALFVLSVVWLWESATCGRCFVSVYLAPVVIVGNLGMAAWGLFFHRHG